MVEFRALVSPMCIPKTCLERVLPVLHSAERDSSEGTVERHGVGDGEGGGEDGGQGALLEGCVTGVAVLESGA